jgi:hypothetical protein
MVKEIKKLIILFFATVNLSGCFFKIGPLFPTEPIIEIESESESESSIVEELKVFSLELINIGSLNNSKATYVQFANYYMQGKPIGLIFQKNFEGREPGDYHSNVSMNTGYVPNDKIKVFDDLIYQSIFELEYGQMYWDDEVKEGLEWKLTVLFTNKEERSAYGYGTNPEPLANIQELFKTELGVVI